MRLTWIGGHYETFKKLAKAGAWMQVTTGSLTGHFGSKAKYWGERMLDEGLIHILASDGHGIRKRPPVMSQGREVALRSMGEEETALMVQTRPQGILDDVNPSSLPAPPGLTKKQQKKLHKKPKKKLLIRRLFGSH